MKQASDKELHEGGNVEVRIADRLRQLRCDKGFTLRQLADRVGVTPAYLSRVENHKLSVTISGLERLANALEVCMASFFEIEEDMTPIVLCRKGKGTKGRFRGPKDHLYEMTAAQKKGKLMEPLVVNISTSRKTVKLTSHAGEEYNYLLKGECWVVYGKKTIHMTEGDSVYFDATVPHAAYVNPGKCAVFLVVITSRDYLFHGDISNLIKGSS